MRLSSTPSRTSREAPAGARRASHQLLARAGFIDHLGAAQFSYLPLGARSLSRVREMARAALSEIGAQEIILPDLLPEESARLLRPSLQPGDEPRLLEATGHSYVRSASGAPAFCLSAMRHLDSFHQLPMLAFRFYNHWNRLAAAEAGILAARESPAVECLIAAANQDDLERQIGLVADALNRVCQRASVPANTVHAAAVPGSRTGTRKIAYATDGGPEEVLTCEACGYSAERVVAGFRRLPPPPELPLGAEAVATPGVTTIADLVGFLGIPAARTAKAVFQVAVFAEGPDRREQTVICMVRGDMEVSPAKLLQALPAVSLRPATADEIRAVGSVPGYGSPIGAHGAVVIVDETAAASANLVAGANMEGYHYRNINFGRDYQADRVADLALAAPDSLCPNCGSGLFLHHAYALAELSPLGDGVASAAGMGYRDAGGAIRPPWLGSCRLDLGRLLACAVEEHHDAEGICWPATVAPYQVHMVELGSKESRVAEIAERVYQSLLEAGIDTLFDDRSQSAGVKFADADLIGIPIRLTVSDRSLQQGGVEFKRREQRERVVIPVDAVIEHLLLAAGAAQRCSGGARPFVP